MQIERERVYAKFNGIPDVFVGFGNGIKKYNNFILLKYLFLSMMFWTNLLKVSKLPSNSLEGFILMKNLSNKKRMFGSPPNKVFLSFTKKL